MNESSTEPSTKSDENIIALLLTIWSAWRSGWSLRLQFTRAVTIPTFARPSQMATYSGRLSIIRATVSPRLIPLPLKTWATLLLSSLIFMLYQQFRIVRTVYGYSLLFAEIFIDLLECPNFIFKVEAYFLGMFLRKSFKDGRHYRITQFVALHRKVNGSIPQD